MARRRQAGFTLIEAAVAIAVVAILSGIIVPLVVKNLQDSQIARAKNDVQVIAAAIASQLKDTGGRPSTAVGGFGDGSAQATWQSGGSVATNFTASAAVNTFTALFCSPTDGTADNPQKLFYGQGTTTTKANEFAYKGPYLAADVAAKSDPWGSAYVILGYNAASQTSSGPIWVACAGPDKTFLATNLTVTSNVYPGTWTTTTTGADDIVVRVN